MRGFCASLDALAEAIVPHRPRSDPTGPSFPFYSPSFLKIDEQDRKDRKDRKVFWMPGSKIPRDRYFRAASGRIIPGYR